MKKLIKALIARVKAFTNNRNFQKKIEKRKTSNFLLRKNNESDVIRWTDNDELFNDWSERTFILASFIGDEADILEFGAGKMVIKDSHIKYKTYTPSDIVKRYDETLVCDLNKPIDIDLSKYNAVLLSGVLEYVYDINNVIYQFSNAGVSQIAVSYCCSDIVLLSRDKNGWLSDYKRDEIEMIFSKNNYTIVNYTEWRNQSLYFLKLNK
jgi:hypothetical protein